MESILADDVAEIAAVADLSRSLAEQAGRLAPRAALMQSLEELLAADLDGIVIATPSALHAEQALTALNAGVAVFCQKPLGRTAEETRRVIEAARISDRLLGVDLSYRFAEAVRRIHELCRSGRLGELFGVDLVFHNAYGPDKPWFYDARQSGGGCMMDLGIHLVDLALWNLGFPRLAKVTSRLYAGGERVSGRADRVEDYAIAELETERGAAIRLACSWKLHAGGDAVISGAFYGTQGGAAFRNVNGSFFDFEALHYQGTKSAVLASPPDSWGGRAAVDWARRLAHGTGFHPEIESLTRVADALDRIYENSRREENLEP